jgi:hypothetical protein
MGSRSAWLARLGTLSSTVSGLVRTANFPEVDYLDPSSSVITYTDAFNFYGDESASVHYRDTDIRHLGRSMNARL